ncbi:F-box domain-containing protein [Mycena indigotica]|uniref:F-box domain-containing protein n=1 Tax=Mycena indigotica TaxID=2126181 RepID=A0A8H6SQ72_9AGAR|nr:F-box domain-containing protein [Mycena indigotica]KAF7303501.1 F-box domain-containing protein [Mycena indigotica]
MSELAPELQSMIAAAFLPYETSAAKRAVLDAMLEVLNATMDGLRAERNGMVPIHRLPNELLVHIFSYHPAWDERGLATRMLVCRRWFGVVLDSPTLWSVIDFDWEGVKYGSLRRRLVRSKDAPLRVNIERLKHTGITELLLGASSRLQQLSIAGARECMVDLLEQMFAQSFPLLQDLALEMTDYGAEEEEESEGFLVDLELSGALLSRMPNLYALKLVNISTEWTSLHSLRYLTINARKANLANPIHFHVLLSILRECPELVELQLDCVLMPGTPELYSVVHLQRLTLLHLRDSCFFIEDILNYVVFPGNTRLSLFPLGINDGSDIRALLVPIRLHLRSPLSPAPEVMSFSVPKSEDGGVISNFKIDFDTAANHARGFSDALQPLLGLNSHPPTARSLRQILAKIMHAVPTQRVTHLSAEIAHDISAKTWALALTHLPSLERVDIFLENSAAQLCQALAGLKKAPPLRLIHVSDFTHGPDEDKSYVAPFLGELKTLLQKHRDAGRTVEKLVFKFYAWGVERRSEQPLVEDWSEIKALVRELVVEEKQ